MKVQHNTDGTVTDPSEADQPHGGLHVSETLTAEQFEAAIAEPPMQPPRQPASKEIAP